mmetsp:Transcript_7762/g.17728  ORF Transcript_7762/g.17728 Transcript_7762/m.17728 type:complete len:84 (+) Transcript_7762:110-361(+)
MTQITSALSIVDSRCAITRVVRRDFLKSSSNASCTTRSLSGSKALVASSRRRIAGSRTMDRAMATRCFCPPLSCPPRSPTSVL